MPPASCARGLLGFAGWKYGHQTYHSSGLVRIAFERPAVMTDTDLSSPIQMFDTFMQSQRLLISSRRVLDKALENPIWKTTGCPVPTDPDDYFSRHIKVDVAPRSEFIQISVTDTDPGTAYAAANSVVTAYQDLYNEQEDRLEKNRVGVLEYREQTLEENIKDISNQIQAGARAYGSSDLDLFYDGAVERVSIAKSALERVRTQMAMNGLDPDAVRPASQNPATAPSGATSGAPNGAAGGAPVGMSVLQIAAVDTNMQKLLEQKSALEDDLRSMSLHFGKESSVVKQKQQELENAAQRIDQYADYYRAVKAAGIGTGAGDGDLAGSEARLLKVVEREQKEMVAIGMQREALQKLRRDLDEKQKENEELVHRISVLRTEGSLGGRLSVTSTPEVPLAPDKDQRMLFACAGGLAGLGFPTALVIALALVSRGKFRFADDASGPLDAGIPLLGILPTIPTRSSSHDDCTNAAHSIHQLRVTLRTKAPAARASSIYLVTSSTAGEGKTSLAMALGISLAASGHRTLIMDCDMVGRHLTTKLKMKGEIGLKEAMASGSMRRTVRKVSDNLYAFPVGQVSRGDASSLSPGRVNPLLETARKYFDTVLIDTGPVLGSVEAAVLAREVDGVVFVIGRNQGRPLVERAMKRLKDLGAHVEGFVFNRARRDDFRSSVYASSSTRSSWDKEGATSLDAQPRNGSPTILPYAQRLPAPVDTQFDDFGPLVTSMVTELPEQKAVVVVESSAK